MEYESIIECVANDGNLNPFRYSIEESEEQGKIKWVFKVIPFDMNTTDWYEFSVALIDDKIGKVVVMNNRNMPEYKGKGITEKMIAIANDVLGIKIISSTNNPEFKSLDPEWRTDAATIIWKRLIEKDAAEYDEEKDIYTFKGQ